jgi:hypothetical protein
MAAVHFWINEKLAMLQHEVGVELSHAMKDFHEQVLDYPISP